MLWSDVALQMNEMLLSSGSVIRMRTERMARAGLAPNADDLEEFRLMGEEKLAAASESSLAMARQWQGSHVTLANRAVQQWFQSASAFFSMAVSTTPAQAAAHGDAFVQAAAHSAATAQQLSSTPARVARSGLQPIHAAATANARRLAALGS